MSVIEGMMSLYIREVVIAERVVQAIQRVGGPNLPQTPTPQDQEEALILWVEHVSQALQHRINQIQATQVRFKMLNSILPPKTFIHRIFLYRSEYMILRQNERSAKNEGHKMLKYNVFEIGSDIWIKFLLKK